MAKYYILEYNCTNCHHDIKFKFEVGVEAAKEDAGKCTLCGTNHNVVQPIPAKFWEGHPAEGDISEGREEERRGGRH